MLLLAGFYFSASSLINKAVKYGTETMAPELLGVSVNLNSVDISPFTGTGSVKGLMVGNPKGYSSEKAFSFEEIYVSLAPLSVFSDVIHIKEVRIIAPEFVYEKKLMKSNISELLKTLKAFSSDDDSPPVKFKIDKLVVEAGSIKISAMGIGATLPLPSITLENIGKNGGTTPGEAFSEILSSVFSKVLSSKASLPRKMNETGGKPAKDTGKKFKSLF